MTQIVPKMRLNDFCFVSSRLFPCKLLTARVTVHHQFPFFAGQPQHAVMDQHMSFAKNQHMKGICAMLPPHVRLFFFNILSLRSFKPSTLHIMIAVRHG